MTKFLKTPFYRTSVVVFLTIGLTQAFAQSTKDPAWKIRFSKELERAIIEEDIATLGEVFRDGASPNIFSANGYSPLHVASMNRAFKSMSALVELGADTEIRFGPLELTPLLIAVDDGDLKVIKHLVSLGADVNAETKGGITALSMATMRHYAGRLMEELIGLGANPNHFNKNGYTPIMMAIYNTDLPGILKLGNLGAKVNIFSSGETGGRTPLMLATSREVIVRPRVLEILLGKLNALVFLRSNDVGATALHFAAAENSVDTIPVLLKYGADINAKDNNGCTALVYAVTARNIEAVRTLLELRADANIADDSGRTALDHARLQKNTSITQALVLAVYGDAALITTGAAVASGLLWAAKDKIVHWVKKKLSIRTPRVLPKKSTDTNSRKFFDKRGPEQSQPPFRGSTGGEALMAPMTPDQEAILLKNYRELYEELRAPPPAPVAAPVATVVSKAKPTKASKTETKQKKDKKAKPPTLPNPPAPPQLPARVSEDDVYQTPRFRSEFRTLNQTDQAQIEERVGQMTSDRARLYGDLRSLHTQLSVVMPNGIHVRSVLYELKFNNGLRVYFTSFDGKSILLLAVGDKRSQDKDIASLNGATVQF